MPDIREENSQGKALFGVFDFVALTILLPFFLLVCNMDEMFYENLGDLRLASGVVLLVYALKKIFSFCVYSGDGIFTNLIAAATSMFLSYLLMFPLANIMHLQVTNQLPEYLFLLLVLTYVIYNILYREKLKLGNADLGWEEWLAKLIKLLLEGIATGVVIVLISKLLGAFFSLIDISVGTFFNLLSIIVIFSLAELFFIGLIFALLFL